MIKIERDLDPNGVAKTFTLYINNEDILKAKEKIEQKELELKLVEKQAREAEEELFELVVKQLKEQNFEFDEGQIIYVSKYNFKIVYYNETFLLMDSTYNKNNYLEVKIC